MSPSAINGDWCRQGNRRSGCWGSSGRCCRLAADAGILHGGVALDLDDEMLRWSQTVYGIAHSLHIAHSLQLGNLTTLIASLSAAEKWNESDLGFESCLPEKEFREGSINLDGRDHEEVFTVLSGNIVKVLFVSLTVIADECLSHLIGLAGVEPPNYLTGKAEWVKSRLDPKYEWAANGLLEMCAIRNAIVHSGSRINSSVIAVLEKANVNSPRNGHEIRLSFGDLFRYRRALRTVLGELQKHQAT